MRYLLTVANVSDMRSAVLTNTTTRDVVLSCCEGAPEYKAMKPIMRGIKTLTWGLDKVSRFLDIAKLGTDDIITVYVGDKRIYGWLERGEAIEEYCREFIDLQGSYNYFLQTIEFVNEAVSPTAAKRLLKGDGGFIPVDNNSEPEEEVDDISATDYLSSITD